MTQAASVVATPHRSVAYMLGLPVLPRREAQLQSFRDVKDELRRRLSILFC